MRLDKFLKVSQLVKRRNVANEMAGEGFIYINGKKVKPSYEIKKNDIIEIDMWNYYKKVEILQVPTGNSIAKKELENFIKELEYHTK